MIKLEITVLVDNPDSWIMPYVEELINNLRHMNHAVYFVQRNRDIKPGDIAFFLGCENIIPKETLLLNKHNLVVHESALPKGKGWSPLTWQILEGKNEVPITLLEAADKVDAGCIYYQDIMVFEGYELLDELHSSQGKKTTELCLRFVEHYPNIEGKVQEGEESFYPRRKPKNSEIDANKTIAELFNRFRVADNERYPIFFRYKGYKYTLKIEKVGRVPEDINPHTR